MEASGSREKVESVFEAMDWNNSGTINMQKFLTYVDRVRRRESLRELRAANKQQQDSARERESARDSRPSSSSRSSADFNIDVALLLAAGSRRLNLTSRGLDDEDARGIGADLAVNSTLRFLVLSRNQIGLAGADQLARALRVNSTLVRLDLGSNLFGNAGVISLCEALRVNCSLQRLDIGNTRMDAAGAKAAADMLTVNKSLRELNLRGNHMGNDGAELIGAALRYNTVLTNLFLQENDIDPVPGMRNFVRSLYSIDHFVLERLEGIDLAAFSRILDLVPDPAGPPASNEKILATMRSRRGLHVCKRVMNK